MITLQPGADGGWHYHTGPEFIIVKTGAITLYGADGCSTVYPAGSVIFADVEDATHAHLARNETSEVTTFFVTFFVPPGAPTRIDAPNPGGVCGQ
jgi:quercetin dioxygenase-like cupin family protein